MELENTLQSDHILELCLGQVCIGRKLVQFDYEQTSFIIHTPS